jgi:excinuclease UvrABC helicase subunit UvrB
MANGYMCAICLLTTEEAVELTLNRPSLTKNSSINDKILESLSMSSSSGNKNYESFITAQRKTLYWTIQSWNYKDGAFKDSINKSTSPTRALKMLIDSPLTGEDEKSRFQGFRDALHSLAPSSTTRDLIRVGTMSDELNELFKEDARRQGINVSPQAPELLSNPAAGTYSHPIGAINL